MIKFYVIASAIGVLSTIAFYEGKNALGKAPHRGSATANASCNAGKGAANANDEAIESARQSLADSLIRCQERLQQKEGEEAERLSSEMFTAGGAGNVASTELTNATDEAAAQATNTVEDRFDPTSEEWKELAKHGQVKLSRPCAMGNDWFPGVEELQSVGLKESDAQTVADAYKQANARAWETTRANCAEWLGADAKVVERIGAEYCESILDAEAQKDANIFKHVAEVRAGTRAEDGSRLDPIERYYLAKTRELKAFEADLSRRVGADHARQITQSSTFCMMREQWPEPAGHD
ncbi:hypothetical protein [Pendulispora albinea]|uniref:Uncharacterized protein n=1 Tax=Pendulispora albinea TaxID=2741071 RepID=A0ABZ2MBL6_9BACT